jgi:hypothetical protein
MVIILINVPTKQCLEDVLRRKLFQWTWYKQKHQLCKSRNNYKSIIHQIINLEISNIIQDQMVKIGETMVRKIRITHIINVIITKIIDFDKME